MPPKTDLICLCFLSKLTLYVFFTWPQRKIANTLYSNYSIFINSTHDAHLKFIVFYFIIGLLSNFKPRCLLCIITEVISSSKPMIIMAIMLMRLIIIIIIIMIILIINLQYFTWIIFNKQTIIIFITLNSHQKIIINILQWYWFQTIIELMDVLFIYLHVQVI